MDEQHKRAIEKHGGLTNDKTGVMKQEKINPNYCSKFFDTAAEDVIIKTL